jgi:MraZ protein
MASFRGQAENSIDDKGRVALPAKMRRAISPEAKETFIATRGLEQCVVLYPLDVWERVEEQLRGLNTFQSEARAFRRQILDWVEETTLDGQGRLSLSKRLLDFAGLEAGGGTKARFVGNIDYIEVWHPDVFEAYLNESVQYETVAERVMGNHAAPTA